MSNLRVYFSFGLVCIIFACCSPHFLAPENISNIFLASATIGILAIAAAIIIASGGLDLSIGAALGVSAVVGATSLETFGWQVYLVITLLAGSALGAINGLLVGFIKIPSFVATLGVMSMARGLALIITEGRPVYGLPEQIVYLGQGRLLGLPIPGWIFIIIGVLAHLLIFKTSFGMQSLCIGDNDRAAYRAGVNVPGYRLALYIISGLLAAVAGIIFTGRVNAVDPSAGLTYEMTAITAAILGGTRLVGGRISIVGVMLGALTMGVLQNGLTLLAVSSYYQHLAIGAVLILVVGMERNKRQ